jgi:hypothetical protein
MASLPWFKSDVVNGKGGRNGREREIAWFCSVALGLLGATPSSTLLFLPLLPSLSLSLSDKVIYYLSSELEATGVVCRSSLSCPCPTSVAVKRRGKGVSAEALCLNLVSKQLETISQWKEDRKEGNGTILILDRAGHTATLPRWKFRNTSLVLLAHLFRTQASSSLWPSVRLRRGKEQGRGGRGKGSSC